MAFTQTTSATEITVAGDISITPKTVQGATGKSINSTVEIGTVPADKIWRIVSVSLVMTRSGSAGGTDGAITLNGVSVLASYLGGLATTSINNNQTINLNYDTAYVLTAGQIARVISSSTGCYSIGSIAYIEEDA